VSTVDGEPVNEMNQPELFSVAVPARYCGLITDWRFGRHTAQGSTRPGGCRPAAKDLQSEWMTNLCTPHSTPGRSAQRHGERHGATWNARYCGNLLSVHLSATLTTIVDAPATRMEPPKYTMTIGPATVAATAATLAEAVTTAARSALWSGDASIGRTG
jgi:hypothetical protein